MPAPGHAAAIGTFIVPIVCCTLLCAGAALFGYFHARSRERGYLAIMLVGLLGACYTAAEALILVTSADGGPAGAPLQYYRIKQIASAFYLFGLPFLLQDYLDLGDAWKRLNLRLALGGLAAAVALSVIAVIIPDHFVSVTAADPLSIAHPVPHVRGLPGAAYHARTALLGAMILYAIAAIAFDMRRNRRLGTPLAVLIGMLVAIATGAVDIVHVYRPITGIALIDANFSRFTVGITTLTVLMMTVSLHDAASRALEATSARLNMEGAIKTIDKSERRFLQLAENISEIFIIHDCANHVVLYVSPSYETVWGASCMSLLSSPDSWLAAVHPDDRTRVMDAFDALPLPDRFELEYRIVAASGVTRWIRDRVSAVRNERGETYRLVRVLDDITERKENEERLIHLAYHDMLTGLPNRKAFFERIDDTLVQAKRLNGQHQKALLFIDMENLKEVNDTLGHDVGDEALVKATARLRSVLRESDYIFRFGGDEFTVILSFITDGLDAGIVADKIIRSLSQAYRIHDSEIFLGLNVGISLYPKDGDAPETLIKNADIALNESKRERNAYKFFEAEMTARAQDRLEIKNRLRHAIDGSQFAMHYQPFVDAAGRIVGMEALIRWDAPGRGLVPPDVFIPIAESTGLIVPIAQWTLHTACAQMRRWTDAGHAGLRVAVNLSPRQFMEDNLADTVTRILRDTGCAPERLELEITEGSMMEHPEAAVEKINELRWLGVTFSIDDFGTGYSSLSYLTRFRINNLKIDKSFILNITRESEYQEITRAIIAMAHNLKIAVIAEGVETAEHASFLRALGCDAMQGYHFSRPVPPEEFARLLEKKTLA